MKFTSPIIKKRTSWRTYTNELLERDVREKIINLMKDNDFGSPISKQAGKIRFELLSIPAALTISSFVTLSKANFFGNLLPILQLLFPSKY